MYDSYMKSKTFPLAVPADLLKEVRNAAADTGLSMADTMRQSMRLGLPKLRDQLACSPITNVPPLAKAAARALYSQPEDDAESTRIFMAPQSAHVQE
jgi:hypothetical protein